MDILSSDNTGVIEQLRAVQDDPVRLLRTAHALLGDRLAVMSSFGAESALLLAFVAEAERDMKVLFLNTGKHFPQTLAYRRELADVLGLSNVEDIGPSPEQVSDRDPTGELWAFDPDACCKLRKVEPLNVASLPYDVLVTGRKRGQAATRAAMEIVEERGDGQIRINPLAFWSAQDIAAEMQRRALPPHPLVAEGYLSIGCAPCTRPVDGHEDARSGRWSGLNKTECGIHVAG
ncbi:MAG: phosphoadenylyl-sulfate reductase [Acetobacter sp.]|uniref:phosphoadenylyl-sulfate reductase n=1 Tax=Acetobacter TaxID=434 RepID=UPI000BA5D692|nr:MULTISPECIES: phosphoadenylyl-sulfate reductase [Acetobacter]NHN79970.1 phosphoadenylyl-sulfate reductase [Acetobacter lovaniensis]PEN28829.1 phosphoadenylyl-sulfate reductase [Acetobacter fabarum]GBQ68852.1 phosphoadenosine phosphosulfate reductase [Acetobacter lovaniensis NRIC 0474]